MPSITYALVGDNVAGGSGTGVENAEEHDDDDTYEPEAQNMLGEGGKFKSFKNQKTFIFVFR